MKVLKARTKKDSKSSNKKRKSKAWAAALVAAAFSPACWPTDWPCKFDGSGLEPEPCSDTFPCLPDGLTDGLKDAGTDFDGGIVVILDANNDKPIIPPLDWYKPPDLTKKPDLQIVVDVSKPTPDIKITKVDTKPSVDVTPSPDVNPTVDMKKPDVWKPDLKPKPDAGPPPDLKPAPDTKPSPDTKPFPDKFVYLDIVPPDMPLPDLKPKPDTLCVPVCGGGASTQQNWPIKSSKGVGNASIKLNSANGSPLTANITVKDSLCGKSCTLILKGGSTGSCTFISGKYYAVVKLIGGSSNQYAILNVTVYCKK